MRISELTTQILQKKSFLCVGLDSDLTKIPVHLLKLEHPVLEFNKQIIDATAAFTVAYKPNLAFYECRGFQGWHDLEETVKYIRAKYPEIYLIADAKRGDIGNTSTLYADAFFKTLDFDAVTVAPYMGEDSVRPFLQYEGKTVIVLALTSNKSAADFQYNTTKGNKPLFIDVIEKSSRWGTSENMMYVVGATKASMLLTIREKIPNHFLLVPGVGAQGGSLEEVARYGLNKHCGLLVNASRSIIFASTGIDFADKAYEEAQLMQKEMHALLQNAKII